MVARSGQSGSGAKRIERRPIETLIPYRLDDRL